MARKPNTDDSIKAGLTQGLAAEVATLEGLREDEIDRLLEANPTQIIHAESKKIRLPVSFKAFGIDEIEAYELPELPERQREFAFRWATDCSRTNAEWAILFNVSAYTINAWKHYPKIRAYHDIIQGKRDTQLAERLLILRDKAYDRLSDLLDVDISGDTIESVRKAILDALGVSAGAIPSSAPSGPTVNVNQTQGQIAGAQAAVKTEVGPQQVDLSKMREKIDELALLEEIVGKGGVAQNPAPESIIDQEEATS